MRFISYTQYLWLDLHQSIAGSGCLSGEACGCEQRGDLECGWVGETLWYTSWPHFLPHVVVWYIASLFVCVRVRVCVGYMALVPLHDNNDTLYYTKKTFAFNRKWRYRSLWSTLDQTHRNACFLNDCTRPASLVSERERDCIFSL